MKADVFAILAALFYALNAPLSKVLLGDVPPGMMASLLYLGAGVGMLLLSPVRRMAGLARRSIWAGGTCPTPSA